MARFKSINDIVTQVAIETGIPKTQSIFASPDSSYEQLISLANSCGYELLQSFDWQAVNRSHTIVTKSTDSGKYPLPDDFAYMIDQTSWEQKENVPVGNLSPQEWTYLLGRDLVSYTIYASFRLNQNQIWIFPYANSNQNPPDGLEITFEYISRNWVLEGGVPDQYADACRTESDVVLYEPYLFERLLKVRFLEARGFDSTVATQQMVAAFNSWSGKDKSAPVLSAGPSGSRDNYLGNVPDTGFGL